MRANLRLVVVILPKALEHLNLRELAVGVGVGSIKHAFELLVRSLCLLGLRVPCTRCTLLPHRLPLEQARERTRAREGGKEGGRKGGREGGREERREREREREREKAGESESERK